MSTVTLWNNFPLEYYGGGEVVALQLLAAFRGAGYATRFYSDESFQVSARVPPELIRRKLGDIDVRRVHFRRYESPPFRSLFRAVPPIADLERSDANLVFVDRPPPSQFLVELAASSAVRKTVLLLHGLSIEQLGATPLALYPYQLYLRYMLGTPGRIPSSVRMVTLTNSLRDFLIDRGHPPAQVRTIANGVDTGRYRAEQNDATFDVVFLGRLEALTKGIPLLVKVVDRLVRDPTSDFRFHIVGSGPDEAILARLRGRAGIVCHGFLSEQAKVDILARSNVMIMTSRIEPFGNVVLEALSSGLPVVSTPAAGPAETLGRLEDSGTVAPPTVTAIVQSLVSFHDEWVGDKRRYYQRKAIRSAAARSLFGASQMTASYLGLVSELLSESTPANPGQHIAGPT